MRKLLRKVFSPSTKADSRLETRKRKSKGQSLVEMTFTLPILLMLFSGLVEFGFMLNYYLSLVDATRTVARDYADVTPFSVNTLGVVSDNPAFYQDAAQELENELTPTTQNDTTRKTGLNPATDDVIITVYSINLNAPTPIYTFPGGPSGSPYRVYGNKTSIFSATNINSRITSLQTQLGSNIPCEGLLTVEVDFTYHQVLSLPWMAWLGSPVLQAYTVMPLQSAEPGTYNNLPTNAGCP